MMSRPLFFVPLVTLASFVFMLFFPVVDLVAFDKYLVPLLGYDGWFYIILILIIITVLFVINARIRYNCVHQYEMNYSDKRDMGGDLEIQYTDLKNSKQRTIALQRLKLNPHTPLLKAGLRGTVDYFRGTVCTLEIIPQKGNYNLILGFASHGEMNKVYLELGGENVEANTGGVG
ncbi:MAG: hypothetical protein ACRECH_07540 [Nitrososphaerales archaeon]